VDPRYEEVQIRYLAEMRGILPLVMAWWTERAVHTPDEIDDQPAGNDFERRWPAGPTGHPLVLNVFRRYFLQIDRLNLEVDVHENLSREPTEDDWGVEAYEEVPTQLPVDVLVDDIQSVAPDVYRLVKGMVFIPIGLSPEEEFC
jgi:hypothetical protein